MHIDSVTPEMVTTTSEPMVTVSGTVLNVGDRPVRDVMVRLEHAAAVTSSAGSAHQPPAASTNTRRSRTSSPSPRNCAQGQNVPFTLTYPVRSADLPSLRIDQPGVYPALVNVNGTPDYGAPARLDDARFLLPVLGVPADPQRPRPTDALAAVVAPDTSRPVRVTMLWPLADRPRLARGRAGRHHSGAARRRRTRDLAGRGGRLDTLLSAVDFATSPAVDPGGQVAQRGVPGRRPRSAGHRERDDGRVRRQRRSRRGGPTRRHTRAPARTPR